MSDEFVKLAFLVFAFKVNERSSRVYSEELERYHGFITRLEAASGEDFSDFRVPGSVIQAETERVETDASKSNPYRSIIPKQYQRVETGRLYCDKDIFVNYKDALEATLRNKLTPQERELAQKAKIGF